MCKRCYERLIAELFGSNSDQKIPKNTDDVYIKDVVKLADYLKQHIVVRIEILRSPKLSTIIGINKGRVVFSIIIRNDKVAGISFNDDDLGDCLYHCVNEYSRQQ